MPEGSNILLLSEPSSSPYMFNEQFAAGGLEHGETVYFYSLERPKEEILAHVRHYLTKQGAEGLQFFDCYSVKMKHLSPSAMHKLGITNHAVNVTQDVVGRLLESVGKEGTRKPFRVVIESITESIQSYGMGPTLDMVRQLVGVVQKLGGSSSLLLIKGMHDHAIETQLRHLCDGVIEFGVDRQGFGLYSYISISKMRGVPDATRLLLYKETDKGLWLESTRRVF